MKSFRDWRENGKHLPEFMRDFHDQKDLFKSMAHYFNNSCEMPVSLTDGHVFTVDWFLWFMAAHGYTLQKTRTNCDDFHELSATIAASKRNEKQQFSKMLKHQGGAE